jgi:sec-independent protein translocase protein TatB
MFDISFSEMILIAVVALVVIGPERLPKVARAAGHLLGRVQRYVNDVKSDISREMQLDELKKLRAEIQDSARSVEQSLSGEMQAARQAMTQTAQAVSGDASTPAVNTQPSISVDRADASGRGKRCRASSEGARQPRKTGRNSLIKP